MREQEPRAEYPPLYSRGFHAPAYEFDGKQLYIEDGLGARMGGHPLATYGSSHSTLIDGRAFDILFDACGGRARPFERERFESYLRAITDFEIHHSDDPVRHTQRLPVEEEILRIVTDGGYFT